ncbi:MAG: serine/threonine-protein kinase [Myxococcales bacterium]|nr:serine/threonine-protein kinase [Myxococcales bacterium]
MRLGRYEIIEKLGEGGMAEVFLARYEAAAGAVRQVVVKRMLPAVLSDEQTLKLFVGEARLTMQLSHGNLVQVFDFGEVDGQYFLAMEYVDGLSLAGLLHHTQERGLPGVPSPIAVAIIIEVAKGLHFAHTRADEHGTPLHIIHRDISSENVLVSYEGQVKVTDFGIARARLEGRQFTAPGIFRGKPDYAAPEQARADPQTARVDIYATGLLLIELITGHNPQTGRLMDVVTKGHRLTAQSPLIDESLAAIIDAAIDPNPATRLGTAFELQTRLTSWLATNAPIALASGVPHFMAWLEPDALHQRGLAMEAPPAFRDWLSSWSRRQGTNPEQVSIAAAPTQQFGKVEADEAPLPASVDDSLSSLVTDRARPSVERTSSAPWMIMGVLALAVAVLVAVLFGSETSQPMVISPPTPIELPPTAPGPPPVKRAPLVEPPELPAEVKVERTVSKYPVQVTLTSAAHAVDISKASSGLRLSTLLDASLADVPLLVRRRTTERNAPKLIAASRMAEGVSISLVGSEWVSLPGSQTTLFVFDRQARLFWLRVDLEVATHTKAGPKVHTTLGNAGPDLVLSVDESQRFELLNLDPSVAYELNLRPAEKLPPVFMVEPGQRSTHNKGAQGAQLQLMPGRPSVVRGATSVWLTMLTAPEVDAADAVVDVRVLGAPPVIIRGSSRNTPNTPATSAADWKRIALEQGAQGHWGQALEAWENCLAASRDPSCATGAEVARRNLKQ